MNPSREQIEKEIYNSMREFFITGKVVGIKFSKKMYELIWEEFQNNLKWRLDAIFEKKKT